MASAIRAAEQRTVVRLAGNRFGHETRDHGDVFDADRFTFLGDHSREGAFSEVYFRTRSTNIYHLTREGVLTNANVSAKRGEQFDVKINLRGHSISFDGLAVGRIFEFFSSQQRSWTTPVQEIVAVYNRLYSSANGLQRSVSGYNNIIEDFAAKGRLRSLRR